MALRKRTPTTRRLRRLLFVTLGAIAAAVLPIRVCNADLFTVSTLADTGPGSLRWAINSANARAGADSIDFAVSGTIRLEHALPALSDRNGGTSIVGSGSLVLDGSALRGNAAGIELASASNAVRGLIISGFPGTGIGVAAPEARGNVIQGNWIGANGAALPGNGRYGIYLAGPSNVIGGTGANEGNVIAGNGYCGVFVAGPSAAGNVIRGNYIGTDPSFTKATGNGFCGVLISAQGTDTLIGGASLEASNIIACNGGHGVYIEAGPGAHNTVRRNSIFGNSYDGIRVESGANGGIAPPVIEPEAGVAGHTQPLAIVEIYVDENDEGRVLVDEVAADETGAFESTVLLSEYLEWNVTATATDKTGNTSQFSDPVAAAALTGSHEESEGVGEGSGEGVGEGAGEPPPEEEGSGDAPSPESDGEGAANGLEDEGSPDGSILDGAGEAAEGIGEGVGESDEIADEPAPTEGGRGEVGGVGWQRDDEPERRRHLRQPKEFCSLMLSLESEITEFETDHGMTLNDVDGDGLLEAEALALAAAAVCHEDTMRAREATLAAYEINLLWLAEEDGFETVEDSWELLAAILVVSRDAQQGVAALLSGLGVTLTGDYARVACDAVGCLPKAIAGTPLSEAYEDFEADALGLNEVYAASGDLDGDGRRNERELENALAAGGDSLQFVLAASDPTSDGTRLVATPADVEALLNMVLSCSETSGDWSRAGSDALLFALVIRVLAARRRRNR